MLVDEVVHYEPRRDLSPTAQVIVQEASPRARIPIPGPSTPHSPRTLKKLNSARAQYTHHYSPAPSTPPSFAHPTAAVGLTRMAPVESDAPIQPSSSSSSSRKLLKSRQGSTVPLINPSLPSPSSPVPQASRSATTSSPVSQSIPPPIPSIQTSPSGLPNERARGATRSTSTRPLLSPLRFADTPTVESPSEPRKIEVGSPFVSRYSKVKNKRWALWALYLLFGLGNLILAVRMRNRFPKSNIPENKSDSQRAGLSQPLKELVDLWKLAPLVNVLVTCGLLTIFWAVDKWYPVTFISRPFPELLFYFILFGIQIATIVDQALYVEPAIQWLHLRGPERDELRVEARASSVFMSIQAFIVLLASGVVVYHIVHHIRHDDPKTHCLNVLKHPTCRYIPHAPPASAFFAPYHTY